jgi:hypothetical protein
MSDVLRRFPELAPRVGVELPTWIRKIEDAAAKAACIWMLGEFGLQVTACFKFEKTLVEV